MDIYDDIVRVLTEEDRVILATIIGARGSTPVPSGAKMLLHEGGRSPSGTVGGGCMEAGILAEARRMYDANGPAAIRSFRLTEDDIESGMLCGGEVDILIEPLGREHRDLYAGLAQLRNGGRDVLLVTRLGSAGDVGGKSCHPLPGRTDAGYRAALSAIQTVLGGHPTGLAAAVADAHRREEVLRIPAGGGGLVLEPVIGRQDLIIFGGGHVSKFVSQSAAMAGFRVTVVDDRPEYADPRRFPEAARTLAMFFDDAWDSLEVRPTTSIVIVTRGHKFDELVLERAVRTPARYVGMIGSARKVHATFDNLRARGVTPELLEKVRAPIGLRIGSVTAEEIAISITAELIAVRRGLSGPAAPMSDGVRAKVHRTGGDG